MGIISQRRIEALRNMAKSGTAHESDIARKLLSRLDIEDAPEEPEEYFTFVCSSELEQRLLHQTIAMVLDTKSIPVYRRRRTKKTTTLVKCTKSSHLEINLFFSSYKRALSDELEITYMAFVQKNRIFPTESIKNPEDRLDEKARKILERAESVCRVSVRKQIAEVTR